MTFLNPAEISSLIYKRAQRLPLLPPAPGKNLNEWQFCLSSGSSYILLLHQTQQRPVGWEQGGRGSAIMWPKLSSHPWHRLRQWSGLRRGSVSYCKEKASSKCSGSLALTAGLKDLTVNTSGILPSLFLINRWEAHLHLWEKWPSFCSKQERWDIRHCPIISVDWLITSKLSYVSGIV